MQLIKNNKEWLKYKKIYDKKSDMHKIIHSPEAPDSIPCLVYSWLKIEDMALKVYHIFAYYDYCKELINLVKKS